MPCFCVDSVHKMAHTLGYKWVLLLIGQNHQNKLYYDSVIWPLSIVGSAGLGQVIALTGL